MTDTAQPGTGGGTGSDDLGDRMKSYEGFETSRRLDVSKPVIVRIDGRSFSRFTRGFLRPYDARMSRSMIKATKVLVDKSHALLGYTQSDEISLVFMAGEGSDIFFSGKVQKLTSVLAGLATAAFARAASREFPDEIMARLPHFDARAFNVPDLSEAANCFLWRIRDAEKNAVSMACFDLFSPRQMHRKNGPEQKAMLAEAGVDFEAFPAFFRVGTLVQRATVQRTLTEDELASIPEKHRPAAGKLVTRTQVGELAMPPRVDHAWLLKALPAPPPIGN